MYFPVTPNRSGEILAAGQMQAAATNAQAMSQMGQDIGGALQAIGGIYAQGQQVKSDAKIYGDLIKFAAPVLGDDKGEMLKSYNEMNTRDQANFGRLLFGGGTFATMSQGYNFGRGLQQREDQPFVNQGLQDERNRAGGNQTITIPPVTPTGLGPPPDDAIVMDGANPNDPAGAAATSATPSIQPIPLNSIPGGRDSLERLNRDRKRKGLDPLPIPTGT
jgi:hypothetical protein